MQSDKLRLLAAVLLVALSIALPERADAAASISSAANQTFAAGDPATLISTITITDDAVTRTIRKKNDIRIRIPSSFNMTWDTSITTVTLGGPNAGNVSATLLAYEDGNRTMVLDVTKDFKAGEQFTIADPRFTSFSAPSMADNLELEVLNDDMISAFDDKTITINAGPIPSISSAANRVFTVSDPPTSSSTITIADSGVTPAITTGNDIRIRIPSTFNMTWDTSITSVTIGGAAAGKVSGTLLAYEDGNRTLVLDVTSNFVAGDQITVSDPNFTNFSAPSAADNLELEVNNDNVVTDTDAKTITVNAQTTASLSSAANQTFAVGDPPTPMSTITITDNAVTATITKKADLRIRIPSIFNMLWDTSITTVTIGGAAAAKMKPALRPYEDGGRTMVLDVKNDFAAGDQITVTGPQFTSFSAVSAVDNLELEANNDGLISDYDDKTIAIPPLPSLTVLKASLTIDDPYNGTTNPKTIPAATVRYLVSITNSGPGPVDADSLAISDPIPANAAIRVADYSGANPGPVAFLDGATASGLSYTFTSLASTTDDVEFSDDNQATWGYTPADIGDGTDPAVTDIRINPSGSMAASLGAGDPSFQVRFKIVVQ